VVTHETVGAELAREDVGMINIAST